MEKSSRSSSTASKTILLPDHKDLSPTLLSFLQHHFGTHSNLPSAVSTASNLAVGLTNECDQLDSDLSDLQRKLCKYTVSWIRRSVSAKLALHKLNLNLQSLSLLSASQNGAASKGILKMLRLDLPLLAKELQRIANIQNYAEITLKLEALVGDLEDAALYVMIRNPGDISSTSLSNSSTLSDLGPRQEMLLHAIKCMSEIEDVLAGIHKHHPQWCRLMNSVDARVGRTLAVIRPLVLADYRSLLVSFGWPPKRLTSRTEIGTIVELLNPLVLMEVDKQKSYSEIFLLLCALQHLQVRREERLLNLLGKKKESNMRLWAIDELVSPIASRAEYHCSNWADQPELVFALVYKITRDFVLGVEELLQPLIDRARLVSYSAKEAWVYAMTQMLSGFLVKNIFPVLAENYKDKQRKSEIMSSWLHLIDLMIASDKWMQSLVSTEGLLFQGSEGLGEFSTGLSVFLIFCERPDWLKTWAKIELKVACKKLRAELKNEKAWVVNGKDGSAVPDGVTCGFLLYSREDHKAPLIAEFALNMAWEMVEHGRNLPTLLPRTHFIRTTLIRFLWFFFSILVLQCKKLELSSVCDSDDFIRTLCKSINAARYCESKLREWSDNLSFLEMRIAETDLKIGAKDDKDNQYCFFKEEIANLVELETGWLMEVIAGILHNFETLSKGYMQDKERFKMKNEALGSSAANLVISVDLIEALDYIQSQLHVISRGLNAKDFLDLWRSIADGLDHFIFQSILVGDCEFSNDGVSQLSADMQALFSIFQPFCARPEAFFPRVGDLLVLLKMDKEEVKHLRAGLSDDHNEVKQLCSCGISYICLEDARKVLCNKKY